MIGAYLPLENSPARPAVPSHIPGHQWRLLLPLLLLLLAAGSFLAERARSAGEDALRVAMAQQGRLAAEIAAAATRAAAADDNAFGDLRRLRARAAAKRSTLDVAPAELPPVLEPKALQASLDSLSRAWAKVDGAIDSLLGSEDAALAVRDDVEAFQSIATGILVTSDELVDTMVQAEAPPAQLRAAARQLLLIQRISANVRRVLEGGDGLVTAADRFGRDAVLFGEVNNALLNSNPHMGITRVRTPEAREILVDIGREFRRSADLIEQIMAQAVALTDAKAAAAEILAGTGRIADLSLEVDGQLNATSGSTLLASGLTEIFGALAILSLLVAMGHIAAVTRKARIEIRERSVSSTASTQGELECESAIEAREAAVERALRTVIDDLDTIARGESAGAKGQIGNFDNPALQSALLAVRRRLGALARTAAGMSAAGARFVEATSTARGIVTQQSGQVEKAAAVTRIMAAQVESVSEHERNVRALADQSAESARRVSAGVDEAASKARQTLFAARNAAARIRQLNESTRQIEDIGCVVDELCEQCRMLSLNVSIRASLAEQGGAQGTERFAEEVEKLATDARRALKRIDRVNDGVRVHAGQAADSVKQVMWAAQTAAEQSHAAQKDAADVTGLAERLDAAEEDLTAAVEEHTLRMTEVVKAMTSVHEITRRARTELRDWSDSAVQVAKLAGSLDSALAGYEDTQAMEGSIIELPVLSAATSTRPDDPDEGQHRNHNDEAAKRVAGTDPA